jgi:uncharacterized protein YdaU (DUF1376 family)
LSVVKTDIWMPVFIGDYLADTMHLNTEQHGAYLLLLFHLWRKGSLRDDDAVLGKISGLGETGWKTHRSVLAEFFKVEDGFWQHGRVEKEKRRVAAKIEKLVKGARFAADSRWKAHALRNADAMRTHADSDSNPDSDLEIRDKILPLKGEEEQQVPPLRCASVGMTRLVDSEEKTNVSGPDKNTHLVEREETTKLVGSSRGPSQEALFVSEDRGKPSQEKSSKKVVDPRHVLFRVILARYWREKNHAAPEMPWQARDGKALSELLSACPQLSEKQFRQMLDNRAKSAVAHGDRVYLWIGNLTRFQEEITVYNKPASAGGEYRSRAEINRNSIVDSYQRAIEMARTYAEGAEQAGAEPAALDDTGMPAADGPGPGGCSLTLPGNGDHGMAARDAADGQAGTNGPLPDSAAASSTGEVDGDGRQEINAW